MWVQEDGSIIVMKVTSIKTPLVHANDDLRQILKLSLPSFLPEKSVIAITSKVVSLCEGRVESLDKFERDDLVPRECQYYLPRELNTYKFCLSITRNTLVASAGIDESNADGLLVLWPEDPQVSVNKIRKFLREEYSVDQLGVIMTDSHVMPLRWGSVGTCLTYSGFVPVNDYRGNSDLFGRKLKVTQANVAEGLAATAVLAMGEGTEQTPLVLIEDLPFVRFVDHDPTDEELSTLRIDKDADVFSPLLNGVDWIKGQQD